MHETHISFHIERYFSYSINLGSKNHIFNKLVHQKTTFPWIIPQHGDREIEEIIEMIGSGLFCVLSALAAVPVTRCPHGGPARWLLLLVFPCIWYTPLVSTVPTIPACTLHSLEIYIYIYIKLVFLIHDNHDSYFCWTRGEGDIGSPHRFGRRPSTL